MQDTPLPYTANPFLLFINDFALFFHLSFSFPGLLGIIRPLRPCTSGKLDELSTTPGNLFCLFVHTILFFAQLAVVIIAILSPFVLVVPAPIYFGGLILAITINGWICKALLQIRPDQRFHAGKEFARNPGDPGEKWVSKQHPEERWMFINGVGVGMHWMDCNLQLLATTFRRPILGIYNPTYGIVFDVLETIIQRSFGYATLDIRRAYKAIAVLLTDTEVKKLVLIAHSQGAVELGMALDWIYLTMRPEDIAKLEVYTFGNAARYWNCPKRRDDSRAIHHVEHYINRHEWVGRFGALFARGLGQDTKFGLIRKILYRLESFIVGEQGPDMALENRFVGTLFVRDASGHLLNQHYLDHFFPVGISAKEDMSVDEDCQYMNSHADAIAFSTKNIVVTQGSSLVINDSDTTGLRFKVKDKSRLWRYRNGQSFEVQEI